LGELDLWRASGQRFIVLGETRFSSQIVAKCREVGPEAYMVRGEGNILFLAGAGDRGTLYAAYQYLADLGCRWLTPEPEGEFVPSVGTLPPFEGERLYTPALIRRDLADLADIEPAIFDWLMRNRVNSACAQSALDAAWGGVLRPIWSPRGGCYHLLQGTGHNFPQLVPSALWDEHPEWFALIGG